MSAGLGCFFKPKSMTVTACAFIVSFAICVAKLFFFPKLFQSKENELSKKKKKIGLLPHSYNNLH